MKKVQILTDSCSDLTLELMTKYGIDYVKMTTVTNGEEAPARLEWTAEEAHAFYDIMRGGTRITTTQVPVEEFRRAFRQYLGEGCDIVYIACSSKQSGSVNTGSVIAKEMMAENPDAKIFCIDSLNASIGEGMLAIEAAKMASDGKSAEEIVSAINGMKKNVQQFVTVHTLDYLKRAGRVKASSAFLGNLMGVKPILVSDVNGTQTPCKKVKGRQNSLREIVALLKENILDSENQTIYVANADCSKEECDALVAAIKQEIPCKEVCLVIIGPIIGASIGPDAFGVWGVGKPVTFIAG